MFIVASQTCAGWLVVADRDQQRWRPTWELCGYRRQQTNKGRSQLEAPAIRYCMLMHSGNRRRCFYAARFLAAHLFFIASLIRLRADADKWRFTPLFEWAGRPGPRFRPCRAKIAALRRSRSASNASMIVAVSMLLLGENECTDCTWVNKVCVRTSLEASCIMQHPVPRSTAECRMALRKHTAQAHCARRHQNDHER